MMTLNIHFLMKLLFIVIFLFSGCYTLQAQPPAPGSNVTNNYINKFEGTWKWINGSDTLVLILMKKNESFTNYSADVLLGVHKYVQNGVTIQDVLYKFDSISYNYKNSSLMLSWYQNMDTTKVKGAIKDLTKKKTNNLYLQYIDGTPPTLIWHLKTAEGTFIDPNFQYGLTMPKDLILTKQ